MLTINCILSDLVNQLRIKQKYGICDSKLQELVKCATSYYWIYNNAYSCLDDCEKKDIDVFIKNTFNCKSFTLCSGETIDCSTIVVSDDTTIYNNFNTNFDPINIDDP